MKGYTDGLLGTLFRCVFIQRLSARPVFFDHFALVRCPFHQKLSAVKIRGETEKNIDKNRRTVRGNSPAPTRVGLRHVLKTRSIAENSRGLALVVSIISFSIVSACGSLCVCCFTILFLLLCARHILACASE